MRKTSWTFRLTALGLSVLGVNIGFQVCAQEYRITRITDTVGNCFNRQPSISGDGRKVAFVSDCDLTGGNPDGNGEIFLFNQRARPPRPPFLQITKSEGGGPFANMQPALSADGQKIAFVSSRNLTGKNGGESQQIFRAEVRDNAVQIKQITDTNGGINFSPAISADGRRIAFVSDRDLLPGQNADGNWELFLAIIRPSGEVEFRQVTHTIGGSNIQPSINADGTRIAFVSDCDLTGTGRPVGSPQLFLASIEPDGITQIAPITNPADRGSSAQPSINADGTRIAFVSNQDLAGQNPNGNMEIFLWAAGSGFIQVTKTSGGFNSEPAIDAAGTQIALVSDGDLVSGRNLDGNKEIFLWDLGTSAFTQVTSTTGRRRFRNNNPSISSDGTRIAFVPSPEASGRARPPSLAVGQHEINEEIIVAERSPHTLMLQVQQGQSF